MYPDYWDEYWERCIDSEPKPKVKPQIPTKCSICDTSLEGQTKSFTLCNKCYEHCQGHT